MKLLITRPKEDAMLLAEKLRYLGHSPVIEPLFDINPIEDTLPPLDNFAALIFTSANGVRAFTSASHRRDLKAFAVGDQTSRVLHASGFTEVFSAAGDTTALAALIRYRHAKADGALLHIAGVNVAGLLVEQLSAEGYEIARIALYQAKAASQLSESTALLLEQRGLDGVLFLSPRTADLFERLTAQATLVSTKKTLYAWCLSPAVAEKLTTNDYAGIFVAPEPTQSAMLEMIETMHRGNYGER